MLRSFCALALLVSGSIGAATAQTLPAGAKPAGSEATAAADVDSLVARALSVNPAIRAASDRLEAARAAVGPAGLPPDPGLSIGVMNVPLSDRDAGDMTAMRMNTVGVGQVFPYPGKLGLRRRVAELEAAAADARLAAARWEIEQQVRDAFYSLAFYDQALGVVRNNEQLLTNFIRVTETRYGVGTGGQQDVLKARVETARLAEEAVALTEQRRAALARLNAALDRPSDTPVGAVRFPVRVARAAVADSPADIRFASAELGARAEGSLLPSLAEMQETAVRQSPRLRAREAEIAAEQARAELAERAYLPDFNVSLQYGQRSGRPDLVSAVVSLPLPLRKGSKQDVLVKEARARVSALEAARAAEANEIRAEVAAGYADLERDRAQLALFVKSIIPQGRASLESATAGFQVGRNDFLTLLENQTTLYNYETAYYRLLTSFGQRLAKLERTVGEEILR